MFYSKTAFNINLISSNYAQSAERKIKATEPLAEPIKKENIATKMLLMLSTISSVIVTGNSKAH